MRISDWSSDVCSSDLLARDDGSNGTSWRIADLQRQRPLRPSPSDNTGVGHVAASGPATRRPYHVGASGGTVSWRGNVPACTLVPAGGSAGVRHMIKELRAWARVHTERDRYSTVGISFHWIMALMILFQLVCGWYMSQIGRSSGRGRVCQDVLISV